MEKPLISFLHSALVTAPTRRALLNRLAPASRAAVFFSEAERQILQALAQRLLPEGLTDARDASIASLEDRLARGDGDGWRYDSLPPDPEAMRAYLARLEDQAQQDFGSGFAALTADRQDALLARLASDPASTRLFEELMAELIGRYYSHPDVLVREVGFIGMADAAGWHHLGLNERESWEPAPHQIPDLTPAPPPRADAPSPPAQPMQHYALEDEVDAVVIGTGAGGAPLLARLAAAGLRVVALEAGPFWNPARDFATDEREQEKLFWRDERLSAGRDPLPFGANNSGIGVGGSTLHYTAYTPRPREADFRLHTEFGVGWDWPLSYAELIPYFNEVERFLGVSGPSPYPWEPARQTYPLPPLPLNAAAERMQRGCAALGIPTAPAPNAALSAPYEQPQIGRRRACTNRGFCQAGCSIGAKGSMDVTYIPWAIAAGAEVRSEAFALSFEQDSTGRLTGVVYEQQGRQARQRCRSVFLCAGAIETPRLLLLNGIDNGHVGRHFMAHTGMQIWGVADDETHPWKGIPGGLISEAMHRPADADFVGGYLLQSLGIMPVTYATQAVRGARIWGPALTARMRAYPYTVGINICGECLPSDDNYLELSDERDGRGLLKPRIHFSNGENERRLTDHAVRWMRAIWQAAGVHDLWHYPRNAHTLGTCRMGRSWETSVVNADGRVHERPNLYVMDGSVFPSSLSVNPALTLMALSLRCADRFLAAPS